jgi:hypothetical protein
MLNLQLKVSKHWLPNKRQASNSKSKVKFFLTVTSLGLDLFVFLFTELNG